MKIVVTGGCGFIGAHFVRYALKTWPTCQVVNVDKMTYAAHPDTLGELSEIAPARHTFVQCDIASAEMIELLERARPDYVVNFAAETHVDRSILDPNVFVRTNVLGVQNLLHGIRGLKNTRFVQVSTDEVYGTLGPRDPAFTESSPLNPNSPYAASKASGDLIALASHRTYGQDVVITRCSNNFGPYQFPEKLIPLVIANALEDLAVPVYGDGRQVRDWIYVEDHCAAVARVMESGISGETYNIGARHERPNIELVQEILEVLQKPESLIQYVGDRPAHDRRYALAVDKITALGWKPEFTHSAGLYSTIRWYREHASWWRKVRGKEFFDYYQKSYAGKFSPDQSRQNASSI